MSQMMLFFGISGLVLIALVILFLRSEMAADEKDRLSKTSDGKFIWQPDLSHKVIYTTLPNMPPPYGETIVPILVEKPPEERSTDIRANPRA